jgi:hypothetical protein
MRVAGESSRIYAQCWVGLGAGRGTYWISGQVHLRRVSMFCTLYWRRFHTMSVIGYYNPVGFWEEDQPSLLIGMTANNNTHYTPFAFCIVGDATSGMSDGICLGDTNGLFIGRKDNTLMVYVIA